MQAVKAAGDKGVAVVGVCNGFQILCEAGMLPGALLRNARLKYICKAVDLEIVNAQTRFTAGYAGRREARMTIGNGEGNFFADEDTLDRLEGEGQVVFRYKGENPNGSARKIAGIVNGKGNVLGMMPHPDRAFEEALGSADGAILFQSALASA
jgi:phosphoribosylformylglycinamidine synthase